MSQTSYSASISTAFAGMLGDMGAPPSVDSFAQAEASAEIAFGLMVRVSGGDNSAKALSALDNILAGVLMHDHSHSNASGGDLGTTGLKPGAQMNVLQRGRIWVACETACAPGDQVFVRHTAGVGGTVLGAFRNADVDPPGSECIDVSGRCRWISTQATPGGLALLEVDMDARA